MGQLKWSPGRWGGGGPGELYGLPVYRAETDPEGVFRAFRLRRAGRSFRRSGVVRMLTPPDFTDWPLLAPLGLKPVSPEPLVRYKAAELALAALGRRALDPERTTLALRGRRVDRDFRQAAVRLCTAVRRLIISAPGGGEELADLLRREYGVPVLPPEESGDLSLHFSPGLPGGEEELRLFGLHPELDGLTLSAPALAEEDRTALPLLNALWQGGRLGAEGVKIVGIP